MTAIRLMLATTLLVGAALAAVPASAAARCTRTALRSASEAYVAAQAAGDPRRIAAAPALSYQEQMRPADIRTGILSRRQRIDFHRSIYDTDSCQSFTEVVIADPAHPYVLGTRLKLDAGRVSELETLVTDADDWLFKAANTLAYSRAEKWDAIPAAERDRPEAITGAANAYLDSFLDKTVTVPWGSPCARLEGGIYTAKGAPGVVTPADTCNVGVPSDTRLVNRRFIVDRELGAAVALLNFGKNQLPDSHLFRVERGRIRYVHTITVCKTLNCGFPPRTIPDPPAA